MTHRFPPAPRSEATSEHLPPGPGPARRRSRNEGAGHRRALLVALLLLGCPADPKPSFGGLFESVPTPWLDALAGRLRDGAVEKMGPFGGQPYAGGAVLDFDGDRRTDAVLFSHSGHAWLALDVAAPAPRMVQLAPTPFDLGAVTAAAVTDRMGDGSREILLAGDRGLVAYRLASDGRVEPTVIADGTSRKRGSIHVADVDQDGLLDLLVASFICQGGAPSEVFLNRGDGTYEEAAGVLGLAHAGAAWTALSTDADMDGDDDILWLMDGCGGRGEQFFARNAGRGEGGVPRFVREAPHPFFSFPDPPDPYASPMGAAAADFDGDGRLDVVMTNAGAMGELAPDDDRASLSRALFFHGHQSAALDEHGAGSGLKDLTSGDGDLTTWGISTMDFDRDGWPDLAVASAPTGDEVDRREPMRPVLLWNTAGSGFVEVSERAGFPADLESVALGAGDVDGDGDTDLLFGNTDHSVTLLRNAIVHGHNHVRLHLIGATSNALGIGAMVEVTSGGRTQVAEVGGGASTATMLEPVADFGIGTAGAANVRIRWPSGYVQELGSVPAGERFVTEPELLTLDRRVASVGEVVRVRVRPHDGAGRPSRASIDLALVPDGLARVTAAGPPGPDGARTFELALDRAGVVHVRTALDGTPLAVWPKLRIQPR